MSEMKVKKLLDEDGCLVEVFDANETIRYIARQKRKRCLALASWCEATALWCWQAANTLPAGFHATLDGKRVMIEPNRLFNGYVRLAKWSARWRELAEKFKHN